jgi:2-keto-3-deoxy-L-rhamnonate aldolase RhmA
MEFGAQGVIAPVVSTVEQAREVVRHAKYPPYGTRSCGAPVPSLKYESLPFGLTGRLLNEEILVTVIIETAAGLDRVE